MRNTIVLVGEKNKTNNELFQLMNWRFKVTCFYYQEDAPFEKISSMSPELIVVSMQGTEANYESLFEYLLERCADIPVVTISTQAESEKYARFYQTDQFHRLLRPVTGTRILQVCGAVIKGNDYTEVVSTQVNKTEKKHILVVDDNAMVLRNIKGVLEERYSVAVAPSGVHAFLSIGKKKPDLILLDYEMPEMNGKQVMEKIQTEEELWDIPIVFLTSVDSKEIVMELLSLMPAGYMLKPVDSQTLLERIEGIIGK